MGYAGGNVLNTILIGDALETLKTLRTESVDCCITSPPYWGLRDYGVEGQLGLERSFPDYIQNLTTVFREVRRVLKKTGTAWINMGDTYLQQHGKGFNGNKRLLNRDRSIHARTGLSGTSLQRPVPPKNLLGTPWRLAFALQEDGWILRSDIIWHKPNPIPESTKDRPTKSHEYLFLLVKSPRYYYDRAGGSEPCVSNQYDVRRMKEGRPRTAGKWFDQRHDKHLRTSGHLGHSNKVGDGETRNRRTVWKIPTQPFKGAHFATFPEKLIEPCILAGCPEGGLVLDPFFGAGTTGVVAKRLKRNYLGIELNVEYAEIARARIEGKP